MDSLAVAPALSRSATEDEGHDCKDEPDYEQYPGDLLGDDRDAADAEYRGDDGNDQKYRCPVKHKILSVVVRHLGGGFDDIIPAI
jgi:hypothetical protein